MAHSGFKYYYYTPSMAAAVVVLLFWLVATTVHLWQVVITRTRFLIPFLIGVFSECFGTSIRPCSHADFLVFAVEFVGYAAVCLYFRRRRRSR